MRSWLLLLGLSLSACGPSGGGPSSPTGGSPTTVPPATNRVERWQQDIDQLAGELSERHVDPFVEVSRETFQAEASSLRSEVPSLDDSAVVAGMMRLVARLGDSHTALDFRSHGGFRQLPLEVVWLSDGIFVARAAEPFRDAVGGRVEGLGNAGIDAAVAALEPLVAYENESWLRVSLVDLLRVPEILQASGLSAEAAEIELEVARPDGETLELDVPAEPRGPIDFGPEPEPLPLYRQRSELNYWVAPIEEHQTLYVHYRRASDMASEPFSAFAARVLETLDGGSFRTLVVDLRENTGGNSSLLEPLLAGLDSRPRWSDGEGVYVVIGRRTFSSGLINALDLESRLGATLVGEPTGGKPNHFGEVRSFLLNQSRLRVTYSTRFFRLIEDADPQSLEPDVLVTVASSDYFAGRDPVLETILDLAGR